MSNHLFIIDTDLRSEFMEMRPFSSHYTNVGTKRVYYESIESFEAIFKHLEDWADERDIYHFRIKYAAGIRHFQSVPFVDERTGDRIQGRAGNQ